MGMCMNVCLLIAKKVLQYHLSRFLPFFFAFLPLLHFLPLNFLSFFIFFHFFIFHLFFFSIEVTLRHLLLFLVFIETDIDIWLPFVLFVCVLGLSMGGCIYIYIGGEHSILKFVDHRFTFFFLLLFPFFSFFICSKLPPTPSTFPFLPLIQLRRL